MTNEAASKRLRFVAKHNYLPMKESHKWKAAACVGRRCKGLYEVLYGDIGKMVNSGYVIMCIHKNINRYGIKE